MLNVFHYISNLFLKCEKFQNSHSKFKHCKSRLPPKKSKNPTTSPYPFLLPDALFKVQCNSERHHMYLLNVVIIANGSSEATSELSNSRPVPLTPNTQRNLKSWLSSQTLRSETWIPTSKRDLRPLVDCHCRITHHGSLRKEDPQAVGRMKMHLVLTVTIEHRHNEIAPESHSFLQRNSLKRLPLLKRIKGLPL